MIIAIANQKGGSGKTTVTMHLAELLSESRPVLVADADPQASAVDWAAAADDDAPWPCPVIGVADAGRAVHREIRHHVDHYATILVDCRPSADADTTQAIFLVADLVLIPVLPSGTDLRAVGDIVRLAEKAAQLRESANPEDLLPLRAVLNQHDRRRILSREARDALDSLGLHTLSSVIAHREAYRQASAVGSTAWALGNLDSRREFSKIVKELRIDE